MNQNYKVSLTLKRASIGKDQIGKMTGRHINRKIPRPFLKWAGGKGQLLKEISLLYPAFSETYHEPFMGGGAVFFDLLPKKAVISDLNEELINCYEIVKNNVDLLIEALRNHIYDKDYYYSVRAQDPGKLDKVERASRTIYLNRTGFNGLYRVNQSGKFNVPFGRYTNPTICDERNLRACAEALKGAVLESAPFEKVLSSANPGDFVYFDPPYIPVSATSDFTAYQKLGFTMDDQERLACVFEKLADKGVMVLLSNSDDPWIHERYQIYNIRTLYADRWINSNAERRTGAREVIVSSY